MKIIINCAYVPAFLCKFTRFYFYTFIKYELVYNRNIANDIFFF
jgi:hypothetical protein